MRGERASRRSGAIKALEVGRQGSDLTTVLDPLLDLIEAIEQLVGRAKVEIEGDEESTAFAGRRAGTVVDGVGGEHPFPEEGRERGPDSIPARERRDRTLGARLRSNRPVGREL